MTPRRLRACGRRKRSLATGRSRRSTPPAEGRRRTRLAETLDEAIRYLIRTRHPSEPAGPVALAGPTCDSADILYDKTDYRLPLALASGDHLGILAAGAYTAAYASIGFNGFAPPTEYYI